MLDFILDLIFWSLPNWLQWTITAILAFFLLGAFVWLWSEGRLFQ